jgi:autotransporter-associated beta strand protein
MFKQLIRWTAKGPVGRIPGQWISQEGEAFSKWLDDLTPGIQGMLTISGGTLDMTGHSIGDATNTIDTLILASGTLKDVAEINGGGAITKTTSGTLILLGTNTYTGQTTVSAGTLLVNNAHAGTNAVQLSTSATLGGSGMIAGNVTLAANATLAPGGNTASIAAGTPGVNTEIGTVQIGGNFTANAASNVAQQLKSGDPALTATFDPTTSMLTSVTGTASDGSNDRLIVGGTLSLDAASHITVTAGARFTLAYHAVFDLIDWSGAAIPLAYYDDGDGKRTGGTTDNAAYALALPDLSSYAAGWFWDVSKFGSTGVIAIVPEPSRTMFLLSGLLGLGQRRRRVRAM